MRILLLSPGKLSHYKNINNNVNFYPRLGLRILHALTPSNHNVTVLEHDQCKSINFNEDVDLVGISVITPFAKVCYKIADIYREKEKIVVLGGVHPTLLPHEAKSHADSVVIGRAENVWNRLLKDLEKGKLKSSYQEKHTSNSQFITPFRYSSDSRMYSKYLLPVQSGIGCSSRCVFCVVPELQNTRFIPREVNDIKNEIEYCMTDWSTKPRVLFNENILNDHSFTNKICRIMSELKVGWSVDADLLKLGNGEYLKTIKKNGCAFIYTEAKAPSQNHKMAKLYSNAINNIKNAGLKLFINFTYGYDDHFETIFDETFDFIIKHHLENECISQILVPWPSLTFYNKLKNEGRLLSTKWNEYDNNHVVFKPKNIEPEKLLFKYRKSLFELRKLENEFVNEQDVI